jgi:hypothetical protein
VLAAGVGAGVAAVAEDAEDAMGSGSIDASAKPIVRPRSASASVASNPIARSIQRPDFATCTRSDACACCTPLHTISTTASAVAACSAARASSSVGARAASRTTTLDCAPSASCVARAIAAVVGSPLPPAATSTTTVSASTIYAQDSAPAQCFDGCTVFVVLP